MAQLTKSETELQLLHNRINELTEDYERIKIFELRNNLLSVRERVTELGAHTHNKMTMYEREYLIQLYQRQDEERDNIPEIRSTGSTLKSDIQFIKKIVKFMEEFYPKMSSISRSTLVVTDEIKEYDILKQEIDQLTKRVEHMYQIISTPSTLTIELSTTEIVPPDNSEDNDPYEHLDYMNSKYLEDVEETNDVYDGPYHTNDPRDDCDELYCDYGYGSNYDGGYDSY
jgi:hypothetical protein